MTESVVPGLDRVPIKEAFSFGWQKTKKHWLTLLWAGGLVVAFQLILKILEISGDAALSAAQAQHNYVLTLMFTLAITIAYFLLGTVIYSIAVLGFVNVLLKVSIDEEASLKDFFAPVHGWMWLKYLGAYCLYSLVVGFGFLLLIVPGIILCLKLQFFTYFIVDKHMGPVQALEASWNITKGVKMNLFLFILCSSGILIAGLLTLLIGLVPAVMITGLASVFVYKRLVQTAPEGSF